MKASQSRVIRSTTQGGRTITGVAYNSNRSSPFDGAKLNVIFLTPSLDLELPSTSRVSYAEFPRYISANYTAIPAGQSAELTSQNIVMPQIPDYLIFYVKPSSYLDQDAEFYMPITAITLQFDNFIMMSSMTTEQLYAESVHNGLNMDFNEWIGSAYSGRTGNTIQTVGGFLVLKPGVSFALQSGQSSGLLGNYNLSARLTVKNTSSVSRTPVLTIITVNSGFLESLGGSSRVIKGVLSEADIISAEPLGPSTREGLKRIIGAGFMDSLGSFLSKAKNVYTASKPTISAIKECLPSEGTVGKIKRGLETVGYGMTGAAMAGGAKAGAGKKMSLSQRLM